MAQRSVRRQLTAFLPGAAAEAVEVVRNRFDPSMAVRIAPHVTIVHDMDDDTTDRLFERSCELRPMQVWLGEVSCWGSPEAGIYLPVLDHDDRVADLRAALGVQPEPGLVYRPHVTLVHPRSAMLASTGEAWASLGGRPLVMGTIELSELCLIEAIEGTWRTVSSVPLSER